MQITLDKRNELVYNIDITERKEEKPMGKKKKNGNQDKAAKLLILITALINLISAIIQLIGKLTE